MDCGRPIRPRISYPNKGVERLRTEIIRPKILKGRIISIFFYIRKLFQSFPTARDDLSNYELSVLRLIQDLVSVFCAQ